MNAASLDREACYAVFKAHDARFDGRLFVGVSSTGIYCRPVCRVKMPKAENCTFHASAAAAELAGFRPCLKCRPELSPANAAGARVPADAMARIARDAALAIEEDNLADRSLSDLARALGVTDRHLRRAFTGEYGVTPVRYLQTRRLLLAKNLLTDTALSVTDAAFAAGFGSVRRFNDLFRKQYRLSPTALRKRNVPAAPAGTDENGVESVTVKLGYRPPYAWDRLLAFLASRAIPGVEIVSNGAYRRTAALRGKGGMHQGWIAVTRIPRENVLAVTLSSGLLPVLPKVLSRVRHLFDCGCHPMDVADRLAALNERSPGLFEAGTRLPGCFDSFEMAVRAILGQQITVKAARTLAMRFASAFGQPLATPFPDLTHIFPAPETIAALTPPIEDRLGPLGIIGARARSIFALANALASGAVSLSQRSDPEETMAALRTLPGFGPWTVHYVAMRALAWPDAFPHTDLGIIKALPSLNAKEILELAEAWRPWRSYAAIALWESLAAPASPKE